MNELLKIGILSLVLTLAAYRLAVWLRQKTKLAILSPVVVGAIFVLLALWGIKLPQEDYQEGMKLVSWLLTPATVSLAIPMYEHLQTLRKSFPAVLVSVITGSASCIVTVLLFAPVFGFDRELTVSLLPKSVTTAIGVPLSQLSGGLGAVTTAAIAITGNLAAIIGPALCKVFRLTDPVAQGVAYGTSGHVVGTSKASELGDLPAAAGSLSLVIAGILTAIVFPLITRFVP
jgi:putative effector of murein hydrolase